MFEGRSPLPGACDIEGPADAVAESLGAAQDADGPAHALGSGRVLATVLFTDIVGSTERAAELGDRAWRDVLDRHHDTVHAISSRPRDRHRR